MLPDKYETRGTRRPDKQKNNTYIYNNPSPLLEPARIPHVMAKVVQSRFTFGDAV